MGKFLCFALSLALVTCLHAENTPHAKKPPSPMFVGAYGGYGVLSGAYKTDGMSALGRFVLGVDAYHYKRFGFGLEAGLQSGNTIRLEAKSSLISTAGGLPIQATLKPFVDFLAIGKFRLMASQPLYFFIKGGAAFRQLQLEDRTSTRDHIKRVNGEIQAGFSYRLTRYGRVSINYQCIFSNSNAGITLAPNNNVLLNHIPIQQGAFIGVEYSL